MSVSVLRGKSKLSLLKNLDFLLNADTPIAGLYNKFRVNKGEKYK